MLNSIFPTPFDRFHFHPTLGLDPAFILLVKHCVLRKDDFSLVRKDALLMSHTAANTAVFALNHTHRVERLMVLRLNARQM